MKALCFFRITSCAPLSILRGSFWLPLFLLGLGIPSGVAASKTWNVPGEQGSLLQALEQARSGDTILVAAGRYTGGFRIPSGVRLQSDGNDEPGKLGLRRAEQTIIEGTADNRPGVEIEDGAVLDGFTITGVGVYDEALWNHHHETRGEEQHHGTIGKVGTPGVLIRGPGAVLHNIVHHNGATGILILGSEGKQVSPRIVGNTSYRNMGGGIGSMNGSTALIQANHCFENFHAGIGHHGGSPHVLENDCHDNIRAGIGISDGASPLVEGNRCYHNRRAGIGIRTGSDTRPRVVNNECRDNGMAGIGVEEGACPVLIRNRVINNRLVAIGIVEGSRVVLEQNELSREGGVPPLVAIRKGSYAEMTGNRIRGGGVAGLLVEGSAVLRNNVIENTTARPERARQAAVWVRPGSTIEFIGNQVLNWPRGLVADRAESLVLRKNQISGFRGVALVVKDSAQPVHIEGNLAISVHETDQVLEITGSQGKISSNRLQAPKLRP